MLSILQFHSLEGDFCVFFLWTELTLPRCRCALHENGVTRRKFWVLCDKLSLYIRW